MKTKLVGSESSCAPQPLRIVALVALVLAAVPAQGFFPTFPPGHFNGEGNSFSTVPFTGSSDSVRFQQVFDAAGFIAEGGNTPYLIHELQLRTDGNGPGFFSRFPAFQISLSTTTRPVDGLSADFARNIGVDIRNFGGGSTSWGVPPFFGPAYVDAVNELGDRVSSVFANDVNALSGTTSTLGLVTRIGITPVPEPGPLTLLLAGLAVFGVVARQRKTHKG